MKFSARQKRQTRQTRRGGGTWTDWMLGRTATNSEQPSKTSWSFFGKSPTKPSNSIQPQSNLQERDEVTKLLSSFEDQIEYVGIKDEVAQFRELESKIKTSYPEFINRLNEIKKNTNYDLDDKIKLTQEDIEKAQKENEVHRSLNEFKSKENEMYASDREKALMAQRALFTAKGGSRRIKRSRRNRKRNRKSRRS